MSVVNVQPSRSAAGSVSYVFYGTGREAEERRASGESRAAAVSSSMDSPEEFVALAEARAAAHGRSVQAYTYVQSFAPDEFNREDPADVQRVNALGKKLAERLHSADFLVVTHDDGEHLHNHVIIQNHDNLTGKSLSRFRSWQKGLHQENDNLMREEGCRVLASPTKAKPDWDQSRERFAEGGFERELGDRVADALRDPRSQNREGFEAVLAEKDVRLAVTDRDGFSYKMRRSDNGKLGRKKASRLSPEFTAEGTQAIFDFHARRAQREQQKQNETKGKSHEHSGRPGERREPRGADGSGLGIHSPVALRPVGSAGADRRADGGGERSVGVDLAAARRQAQRDRQHRDAARRDRENARERARTARWERDQREHDRAQRRRRSRDEGYGLEL